MRLFAAITLGPELQKVLGAAVRKLQDALRERRDYSAVRWVPPDKIHLTLKFLGQVDEGRIPEVIAALEESSSGITQFKLTVHGLGCFPNARRPTVIWAGLASQVSLAAELVKRLEDSFDRLGFPRETRPFSPHLTLGRVRREVGHADRAAVGAIVEAFPAQRYGAIAADAIHLIKSDLKPGGPVYTTLRSIALYDPVPRPP